MYMNIIGAYFQIKFLKRLFKNISENQFSKSSLRKNVLFQTKWLLFLEKSLSALYLYQALQLVIKSSSCEN